MKYLIIPKNSKPFLTDWFDYENNYVKGMMVINCTKSLFTIDGKNWEELEEDSL